MNISMKPTISLFLAPLLLAPIVALAEPSTTNTGLNSTEATHLARLSNINPNYPTLLRRKGVEGTVELSFTINAVGSPENIRVENIEGPSAFARSAEAALKAESFEMPEWKDIPANQHRQKMAYRFNATTETLSDNQQVASR